MYYIIYIIIYIHTLHFGTYWIRGYFSSKFKSVLLILAFDMVHDPMAALETLLTLGFERVLTSGCDSSALEGLPLIKQLIDEVQEGCGYSEHSIFICIISIILCSIQLVYKNEYYWLGDYERKVEPVTYLYDIYLFIAWVF